MRKHESTGLRPGDPATLGPYKLECRIGEGSYGVVFKGLDANGHWAAVKLMKAALVSTHERRRFEREVAALQTVESQRVARYLAHGSDSAGVWVAVEFIDGETLWDTVLPAQRGGRFTVRGYEVPTYSITGQDLLEILWQTLVGLRDLHGSGVTHRDLHPGNVMIRAVDYSMGEVANPDVVLLDLGLSMQGDERLTRAGEAIGHWQFTPPEQRGAVPSDWNPAADVFAWAATAAFAAQGYPPHSLASVLDAPRSSADPNLSGVPGDLATVLADCLVADPGTRMSSDQVLRRLRALKADWTDRDRVGSVDTYVVAAGFDPPSVDGHVGHHLDLETVYLARRTWTQVPLMGQSGEPFAVSRGSTITLSAERYGPAGNQDGALTGHLKPVTARSVHLTEGPGVRPPLICRSCDSPLRRGDPDVAPGLHCSNRLRCPQQVLHRCSLLRKPGADSPRTMQDRRDVMALPLFLFRLVSLGVITNEAEVFSVRLDARQDPNDESLEGTGLTQELLEQAEQWRDELLKAPPATILAALIGTSAGRAEELIVGLGDIRRIAEVARRQLQCDEFVPPWPRDRHEREAVHGWWYKSHLKRQEADLLDSWRTPVFDSWEASGMHL